MTQHHNFIFVKRNSLPWKKLKKIRKYLPPNSSNTAAGSAVSVEASVGSGEASTFGTSFFTTFSFFTGWASTATSFFTSVWTATFSFLAFLSFFFFSFSFFSSITGTSSSTWICFSSFATDSSIISTFSIDSFWISLFTASFSVLSSSTLSTLSSFSAFFGFLSFFVGDWSGFFFLSAFEGTISQSPSSKSTGFSENPFFWFFLFLISSLKFLVFGSTAFLGFSTCLFSTFFSFFSGFTSATSLAGDFFDGDFSVLPSPVGTNPLAVDFWNKNYLETIDI